MAVNRELIVNAHPHGMDIALLEDKELVELHKDTTGKAFLVGDLYLGRITRTVTGLNAAFVDVGFEKDAFLHYTDLGPQIKTMQKVVRSAVAGNLDDPLLQHLEYEEEIVKTGKIDQAVEKRQLVLVQILKEPISTKGPRLTCDITLPGRYIVLLPFNNTIGVSKKVESSEERKRLFKLMESIRPKNFGIVVRTVAEGRSVAELHEDMSHLLERWKTTMENLKGAEPGNKVQGELNKANTLLRDLLNDSFHNIIVNDSEVASQITEYLGKIAPDKKKIVNVYKSNTTLFDTYGITRQIKTLFGKIVTMPGGSYLVIEHTEALHVIDVNSGQKFSKGDGQENTALKVNMEAAKEIARQLRLRDIGGIIVVDFIDMKNPENKRALYQHLKTIMESDRARHTLLPLSKFGLMEITRERTRPQINIATTETCPTCEGTGKIQASLLLSEQIERGLESAMEKDKKVKIFAHPIVEAFLKRELWKQQRQWWLKYKRWIPVISNQDYHLTEYRFMNEKGEEIGV